MGAQGVETFAAAGLLGGDVLVWPGTRADALVQSPHDLTVTHGG
jgi:hypothetical protein